MKARVAFAAALLTLYVQAQTAPPNSVLGYPTLDANRVYGSGQKVKVDEPGCVQDAHGVYTGCITMDGYYFIRVERVTETQRATESGTGNTLTHGWLSANIRHATNAQWQTSVLNYECYNYRIDAGEVVLANSTDGVAEFRMGQHESHCDLKAVAKPTQMQPAESVTFDERVQHLPPIWRRPLLVEHRLGVQAKVHLCGPHISKDSSPPCAAGANAWALRASNLITLNEALLRDVQSDDEMACVIAHEAGHIYGHQVPYTTLENKKEDELLADMFAVPLVMYAGYDARACPRMVDDITEHPTLTKVEGALGLDGANDHTTNILRERRMKEAIQMVCTGRNLPQNSDASMILRIRQSPACIALALK